MSRQVTSSTKPSFNNIDRFIVWKKHLFRNEVFVNDSAKPNRCYL